MSDHDTHTDPGGWGRYLRAVTFLDHPGLALDGPPVHVTSRTLFDGVPVDFVSLWAVGRGEAGELILYLTVDAKAAYADPTATPPVYKLGRHEVLLPADHPGGAPALWKDNEDGTYDVAIFVDQVHWQPHTFGDRVKDGGVMGTLVRCEQCGGSGQLHQPDQTPEPVEPAESPS
jgi:hypothetical protein